MPSLEMRNINVFYGEIQALWDISLTVESGSIATLIGSNGSGKSTLLKTIIGLVPPRSGEILYDGKSIDGLATDKVVDAGIAYAPEGRHLFPDFSVEENLRMGSFPSHARKFHDEEVQRGSKTLPILW